MKKNRKIPKLGPSENYSPFRNFKRDMSKKNKIEKDENTFFLYKLLLLIPDGIFGVIVYVLVILLCIYFLGDYGYERGPRFFGDPG